MSAFDAAGKKAAVRLSTPEETFGIDFSQLAKGRNQFTLEPGSIIPSRTQSRLVKLQA
jgi:hypothetical protein